MRKILNYLKRNPNLESDYKPVILITGCASGIGLALTRFFYHTNKYRTVATVREKNLNKMKERFPERENFIIECLDVGNEANRVALINKVCKKWDGIDILINNAGISYRSVLEHMTQDDEYLQMNTNYFGPISLIRLCLPKMRTKGRGKVICVSSVSGMLSMPTMASYSASKRALEGACEALWYETRPFGIDVTLIQPGFINSESFKNVYYSQKALEACHSEGPYFDFYKSMSPFVAKLMGLSLTTPENIARSIIKVITTERPPLWVPVTFDAFLFYYVRRLVPRRLLQPLLYKLLPNSMRWGARHSFKRK